MRTITLFGGTGWKVGRISWNARHEGTILLEILECRYRDSDGGPANVWLGFRLRAVIDVR
jgi:hypothetical protein